MKDQASKTNNSSGSEMARRSRRQLLARGSGALAAVLAAEVLARPAPAAAANGDPVVLGQANTATSGTHITNSTAGDDVLFCSASGDGTAVFGITSGAADGVVGHSGSRAGVHGLSSGKTGNAVSVNVAAGVLGVNDAGGSGVTGVSITGYGVFGFSDTGNGVFGLSDTDGGTGVSGENAQGTGVRASGKTALQVTGPAVFSRSGILTVTAGHSSAKKAKIALTPASLVLATIQGNVAGVFVQGVTLVTGSAGSFTIHLNKTVSKSVKVAWFAVN